MSDKIVLKISPAYRKYLINWGLRTGELQRAAADAWEDRLKNLKDQSKPLDLDLPGQEDQARQPETEKQD